MRNTQYISSEQEKEEKKEIGRSHGKTVPLHTPEIISEEFFI